MLLGLGQQHLTWLWLGCHTQHMGCPLSPNLIYKKVSVNLFWFREWDIQDPPLFLGLGISFEIHHLHLQGFIFNFTIGEGTQGGMMRNAFATS